MTRTERREGVPRRRGPDAPARRAVGATARAVVGRTVGRARRHHRSDGANLLRALLFLLPALLLLGALVVYPIVYSVVRSLFGAHRR